MTANPELRNPSNLLMSYGPPHHVYKVSLPRANTFIRILYYNIYAISINNVLAGVCGVIMYIGS